MTLSTHALSMCRSWERRHSASRRKHSASVRPCRRAALGESASISQSHTHTPPRKTCTAGICMAYLTGSGWIYHWKRLRLVLR